MLDFAAVISQIETLFNAPGAKWNSMEQAIQLATQIAAHCDRDGSFNASIRTASETGALPDSWHPALSLEDDARLLTSVPPPPEISACRVVATDGSQVYPDPHHIADCWLINLSHVTLRYGNPNGENNALLAARSIFSASPENDTWLAALKGGFANREFVDARRHVAELDELASLLESVDRDVPAAGLCDGIFDLRVSALQSWRTFALEENERALDRLRACDTPVAGYIAASRASDVITGLQVVMQSSGDESTDSLSGLQDATLFDSVLASGHRSATFQSGRLQPGEDKNGAARKAEKPSRHLTCFFYLKTNEGEVARLEFPHWVAIREEWLDLLHSVVLSQLEKGDGYPIALMEAHEHAVVRASDREAFYTLIEDAMLANGLQPRRSAKGRSKSRPLV